MNDSSSLVELLPSRRSRFGTASHRMGMALRMSAAAVLTALLACSNWVEARAQSLPTASRVGDLQIGGGFVFARSGYNFTPIHLIGGAAYTTFDWNRHLGAEFNFHRIGATENSTIHETTFEIGPRVYLTRGRLKPYAKVMYGRGVYNFSNNVANVAYNVYTFGGGSDYSLFRALNVRADYEYQNWAGFPLGTLHPSVVSIGIAYHFR